METHRTRLCSVGVSGQSAVRRHFGGPLLILCWAPIRERSRRVEQPVVCPCLPSTSHLCVPRVTLRNQRLQSGSGIIAAAAWKTPASHIGDESGESHADGAGQQDGGVRPLHHPMKHKRHFGTVVVVEDLLILLPVGECQTRVA